MTYVLDVLLYLNVCRYNGVFTGRKRSYLSLTFLPDLFFSPLSRISYCTADKMHDKVFAYIAQNKQNQTLECHAFLCAKRKVVSVLL